MARICDLTGKRPNVAHRVSHSNIKTKRRQLPNLQVKRIWWEEEKKWCRSGVTRPPTPPRSRLICSLPFKHHFPLTPPLVYAHARALLTHPHIIFPPPRTQ